MSILFLYRNWVYIIWFLFYFLLFWLICGANIFSFLIVGSIYGIAILFSLSSLSESLWRSISGVRPLRTNREKERLIPLFKEVYTQVCETDNYISKEMKLYIQENMNINAFAFGRTTLVLTRGSIETLNDDCLKGLMAHEFGHFAYADPTVLQIAMIGNVFMLFLSKLICSKTDESRFKESKSILGSCFKALYDLFYGIYRFLRFIGDVMITSVSREHEYWADGFAFDCGYGPELIEVLYQLYAMTFDSPGNIKEQLRSTHPPITKRIEELESYSRDDEPETPEQDDDMM